MRAVLKYGGSSVATTDKIKAIANYLKTRHEQGDELVVVVSAMGKTTDQLIQLANEITDYPNLREMDRLLSTGEQQTIALLAIALESIGVNAVSLTGVQAGLQTDVIHTKSKIVDIDPMRIESHLQNGEIVIIAGFQGVNEYGDITTLGRGGSDTSAVAFAAALKSRAEIYTDVPGIFSADPRVLKGAKPISEITYDEMMEMANLGSKIMEVRSVELGKKYGVEIFVGRSLDESGGTLIKERVEVNEEKPVTGLATVDEVLAVEISGLADAAGTLGYLFQLLAKHNLNIDMITQASTHDGTSVSFTINSADKLLFEKARVDILAQFPNYSVTVEEGLMKLSVVGVGMASHTGVAARVFEVLGSAGIGIHQVTTSEISISVTIGADKKEIAVSKLGEAFVL